MYNSNISSDMIIAGIIVAAIALIIGTIILIWFIVTLNDIKSYLKSIDFKLTKSNQNLCDIKLYGYQLTNSKKLPQEQSNAELQNAGEDNNK